MREPQVVPRTRTNLTKIRTNTAVAPIALSEHLGVVTHHRALVAAVAATVAIGGTLYAYSKPPVYEGNLLVSVSDIRGAEQRSVLGSPALVAERKTAMSESEMLRSRVILGPVVDKLKLDVNVDPKYLPIVGRAFAAWNAGRFSWPWPFGGYSWSNDKAKVSNFEVPPSLLGANFVVTKIANQRFRLKEREIGLQVDGEIGSELRAATSEGVVKIKIDQLPGNLGSQFFLRKDAHVLALEKLRASLSVSELGKESGMLSVSLTDSSPERVKAILNEVGNAYMSFIRDKKDEQSTSSLNVLQAQLPELKERVERAEIAYEEFRRVNGTADLTEETKLRLGRYSTTQAQLADLHQKRAEMSARFGDEHPQIVALDRQIQTAERERNNVSSEIRSFPKVSKELDRRSRQLQAETELYYSVVKKIEEMKVVAQDHSTNVKLIDEAVVPVEPKGSRATIVGISVVAGLFLGVFAAFLRRMFAYRVSV